MSMAHEVNRLKAQGLTFAQMRKSLEADGIDTTWMLEQLAWLYGIGTTDIVSHVSTDGTVHYEPPGPSLSVILPSKIDGTE